MASNQVESLRHFNSTEYRCKNLQSLNSLTQRERYLHEWRQKQEAHLKRFRYQKRRVRRTSNEETNRLVWEWYSSLKEKGFHVTGPTLQKEARSIAKRLGISNFAASNGWLESFRRLHNIDFKSKGNYQTGLLSIMNNTKVNTRDHQVAASAGDNEVSVQAGKEITASSDDLVGSSVGDVVAMPHHSLASYDRNDSLSPVVILHTYSILDEDDNDDHNQYSFPPNSDADASSLNEDPHFINEPSQAANPTVVHHPIALRPAIAIAMQEPQSPQNTFFPIVKDVNPIIQQQQQRQSAFVSTSARSDKGEKGSSVSFPAPTQSSNRKSTLKINHEIHLNSGPFGLLVTMVNSQGLGSFEYSDDRGESWMEIRPPPAATIQVPIYGYRTHLMRLIVNSHLDYWMEALGQCINSGSFLSLVDGGLDVGRVKTVLGLLAGGVSLCQGRDEVHAASASEEIAFLFTLPDCRFRSYNCSRLVDSRTGQTQCLACSGTFPR